MVYKSGFDDGDVGIRGSRLDRFLRFADCWFVKWEIPLCLQLVADHCPEYGRGIVTGASCHLGSGTGQMGEGSRFYLFVVMTFSKYKNIYISLGSSLKFCCHLFNYNQQFITSIKNISEHIIRISVYIFKSVPASHNFTRQSYWYAELCAGFCKNNHRKCSRLNQTALTTKTKALFFFKHHITLHSSCSTCGSSSVSFSNICLFQPRNRSLVFSLCPLELKLSAVLEGWELRQWNVMLWLASLLSKWRNFICTFPMSNTICWREKVHRRCRLWTL